MDKFIYVLFIFFGIQIYSQENAFNELDEYLSDYRNFEFEKFKYHKFQNLTFEVNTIEGDSVAQRKIDWKITETIYALEISYLQEKSFKYKFLTLRTFSQNGEIFLILYHKQDYFSEYFEPKYFGREDKINSILKAHNDFYQSNLNFEDMVEQISEENTYGYACGEAPIITKIPSYKGLKYNDNANVDQFRNWIQSFNPELQTYGVNALEYLEKNKNLSLTEHDKKIINHIKSRNSLLNSCSGCLYGIYEKAFD